MATTPRLRDSEYGGADTQRTHGIQPAPHQLRPEETLRVIYAQDPTELGYDVDPGLGEVKTEQG